MADALQSKVTDDHRALIGRDAQVTNVAIDAEDVRRIRDVMDDDDPRWADGSDLAPPYIMALFIAVGRRAVPSILPKAVLTQLEWRFTRPFRAGEQLQATTRVIDIRDRLGGRYGYSVLITTATEYRDEEGSPVAASLAVSTQFDPTAGRSGE